MAGGGVAVEVDGAGVLEDAAEFDKAGGHHGEVGEEVVWAEEGVECAEGFGYILRPVLDHVVVGAGGLLVPDPGVLEGLDLGGGAGAVALLEEDVVVLVALDSRVGYRTRQNPSAGNGVFVLTSRPECGSIIAR